MGCEQLHAQSLLICIGSQLQENKHLLSVAACAHMLQLETLGRGECLGGVPLSPEASACLSFIGSSSILMPL